MKNITITKPLVYKGNPTALITEEGIEAVEVKSPFTGTYSVMEHFGDYIDEETGQRVEFGSIGKDYDLCWELTTQVRFYTASMIQATYDPETNQATLKPGEYFPDDSRWPNIYQFHAELSLPLPRTMGDFANAIEAFFAVIFQHTYSQRSEIMQGRYSCLNQEHHPSFDDPELPF